MGSMCIGFVVLCCTVRKRLEFVLVCVRIAHVE